MNKWMLAAGTLSAVTVVAHIAGGGREIHGPMLESSISVYFKAIYSVIWHAISLILLLNSAVLLVASRWPRALRPAVFLVALQYLGFVLLFVFYGVTRLGNLTELPQWIAFGLIAALATMGLKRRRAGGRME